MKHVQASNFTMISHFSLVQMIKKFDFLWKLIHQKLYSRIALPMKHTETLEDNFQNQLTLWSEISKKQQAHYKVINPKNMWI